MGLVRLEHLTDAQVEDLHRLYLNEWWTHRRNLDDVHRIVEGSDVIVAFAEEDTGALAGFVRVITDFVYKALVLDVIVERSLRGTGLGAKLMDEVIEHPRLKDVLHLKLYCRLELVPFYERWGFTNRLGELQFMRRGVSPTPPSRRTSRPARPQPQQEA